uniref:Neur_chan_LBD domain-containing protein n=1 Tax=Caenorhabditis japonica TaxID=281687 RepID=A0A8R1DUJ6_CAEJA
MSIGIDLGTTFSCVAFYENGQVRVLENENGCRTTPSVFAIDEDGEWIVGQHAKDAVTDATNSFFDVKRIIGRRYDDLLLQDDIALWPFRVEKDNGSPSLVVENKGNKTRFSPISVSAHILACLKKNAERKLGIEVNSAVITVPAYFNAAQRKDTEKAAILSGLKVLRILNEPTAAAIAYSLNGQRLSRRNILIYDLGGGTFDVAVVNVDGPRITVKSKGGDTHLGGQDIDNIIMLKMIENFKAIYGIDLKGNYKALKRLRKAAETAKITLSAGNMARIELDCLCDGIDFVMKISRTDFNKWIENLLMATIIHVERVIREANLKKGQIDEIVLVGGSTRIPLLKEIIKTHFESSTKICESIHPDEAVAHGAAIIAAVLTGVDDVQDMKLSDVIPMSIGIQCNRDYMSVLIKKGTVFPCSRKKTFVNSEDFQPIIDVQVYEGQRSLCSHNKRLGEISFEISPARRGKSVIEVTLAIDHSGILQATAFDVNTKRAITTTIVYDHSAFTKQEIDQLLSQSEAERLYDESFKQRYKQLQKSEDMAFDYKHRLEKIQGSVEQEKYSHLMQTVEREIAWLSTFPDAPCHEYPALPIPDCVILHVSGFSDFNAISSQALVTFFIDHLTVLARPVPHTYFYPAAHANTKMKSGIILLLVSLFGIVGAQKALHSRRLGTEGQIVGRILSEYDANSRPPVRDHADNSAILVITNIFINRLIWHPNHAEVDLYLRQQWQDNRLKYDVDSREGIEEIRLPLNRHIWEPDTYFTSGRELSRNAKNSKNIIIEPSGYVRASERVLLELPYTYGTMFPFTNSRQFAIKLGSYNYDIDDIVYLWANSPPLVNPIEVSGDLLKGDLTFEEANAGDCVGNYTVGVFSCIDANVTFAAGTLSGLMSWFLPSLFLLIGSWLHFWIHGSWSVPRSISAAVPFFILAGYYIFMSEDAYTNAQGAWLGFCLILTFFSFVEYFLVIGCGGRRSIRYKTLNGQEELPMGANKETVEVAYNQGCSSFANNNGIDVISRVLFPVVTVLFLIIYFIFIV